MASLGSRTFCRRVAQHINSAPCVLRVQGSAVRPIASLFARQYTQYSKRRCLQTRNVHSSVAPFNATPDTVTNEIPLSGFMRHDVLANHLSTALRSRASSAQNASAADTTDDVELEEPLSDDPGLVEALFDARVHYGHKKGMWNSDNAWFIAGTRAGIHMIDLDISAAYMRKALAVIRDVVSVGGIILFVNTRTEHEAITRRTAVCCGEHFVTKKWIGGTLTNNMETIGEQLVPDLMIMCGLPVLRTAVKEASQLCVPTIGIVDTNCDSKGITVPVPGNDDSDAAVKLYMRLFANEIIEAKRAKHAAEHGTSAVVGSTQAGTDYVGADTSDDKLEEQQEAAVQAEASTDYFDADASDDKLKEQQEAAAAAGAWKTTNA